MSDDGSMEMHPLTEVNTIIHAPARLMVMSYLYVVESADYVFLIRTTGLTWGNLSTHIGKLEEAGYVAIHKEFRDRKPHTSISLTAQGREAFRAYKQSMQQMLDELPD